MNKQKGKINNRYVLPDNLNYDDGDHGYLGLYKRNPHISEGIKEIMKN